MMPSPNSSWISSLIAELQRPHGGPGLLRCHRLAEQRGYRPRDGLPYHLGELRPGQAQLGLRLPDGFGRLLLGQHPRYSLATCGKFSKKS
jgi:hypothetical protein